MPEMGNRRSSGDDEQMDKYDAIGCEAIVNSVEKPHNQYSYSSLTGNDNA